MSGRLRRWWGLFAVAGSIAMTWAHKWPVSVNDFKVEASQPLGELLQGHFSRFLDLAPAYGGSLELRAPFALIASLSGSGALAIFRATALPCLLAAAGLGIWLVAQMRKRGSGNVAQACVLVLCVANPIIYEALSYGHPEEVLGAALSVGAVLCAMADRPVWAGLLLGLAVGNKEWALVAVGPVLVALPSGHLKAAAIAAATASLMVVPIVLASPGGVAGSTGRLATQTGSTFYPFQVWWFLGHPFHWIPAMAATIPEGSRLGPAWLSGRAHLMIVGIAVPLSLLYHRARRPTRSPLLLLALVLMLRCILDPWDLVYYVLPFILAIVAWESVSRSQRGPVWSVAATIATWILFMVLPRHVSVDVQAIVCLVVALPVALLLARALYGPALRGGAPAGDRRLGGRGYQASARRPPEGWVHDPPLTS